MTAEPTPNSGGNRNGMEALAFIALGVAMAAGLATERLYSYRRLMGELESLQTGLLDAHARALTDWLEHHEAELASLAMDARLGEASRFSGDPGPRSSLALRRALEHDQFSSVGVIDRNGKPRIWHGRAVDLSSARESGRFGRMSIHILGDRPADSLWVFTTPLPGGRYRAAIASSPERSLFPAFRQLRMHLTAETVLFVTDHAKKTVLFVSPRAKDSPAARFISMPLDSDGLLAAEALLGAPVSGWHRDYAGDRVIGVARRVGPLGWGLARKVDLDEALAPFVSRTILHTLIALLAWAVMAVLHAHGRMKRRAEVASVEQAGREALMRAAERHRIISTAVEHSPAGIMITDVQSRIEYVNLAMCAMTGYAEEELIGRTPRIWRTDTAPPETYAQLWERLRAGQDWRGKFLNRRKDGRSFWMSVHIAPLLDACGKVTHFVAINQDHSVEKRAIDDLAAREEQYRRLVEGLGREYFFYRHDTAGIFTHLSPSVHTILGYTPEEFMTHFTEYLTDDPINREVEKRTALSIQGRPQPAYHVSIHHKDRSVKRLEVLETPLFDESGAVTAVEGIAHDITASWESREALRRSEEGRERADARALALRSLGVLAGGVAHDFNNYLTIILGNLSLLKAPDNSREESNELVAEADAACARAKDLARQLITFAKGGAPIIKAVDLRSVVLETARLAAAGSSARLEASAATDLGLVLADEGQIGQVVANLVINAKQAMPGGGTVRVRLSAAELSPESAASMPPLKSGRHARLEVSDEGVGILRENLALVFDPYFTTKADNSGLGLAVCWSIVARHGGRIEVESEPGRGTTFRVWLPAATSGSASASEQENHPGHGAGRILVMDDDENILRVALKSLASAGYDPVGTRDGTQAIRAYREALRAGRPFSAVVLDLTVPGGMGGLEALASLRAADPGVRAVVSSGYSDDGALAEYRERGFVARLVKPYPPDELTRAVAEALGRSVE